MIGLLSMLKKLLIVFFIASLVGCSANAEVDQSDVKEKAKQFVEDKLKPFGNVDFLNDDDDIDIYNDKDNSWIVNGYLEAENRLGTEFRANYIVNMTYFPETETWQLDKLTFSDKNFNKVASK